MKGSSFLVTALLACACSEPEPDARSPSLAETRAETRAPTAPTRQRDGMFEGALYAAPIPEGFERSREHASALVASERRPLPESFLSSILINAIPYPSPSDRKELSDPTVCQTETDGIVEIVSSQGEAPTRVETEILELPIGRSCRYQLTFEGESPHTTQGTALQSDRGDFMVVCNIAVGDARGRAGCDSFVRGWRWRDR